MHIQTINDGVHALYDPAGLHVGNFKWINGLWKFKAIGYDPTGQVVPGGGPLTDRHNTTIAQLDEALIRAQFF
ncbi:hypothetical protein ACHEXK_10560 [Limnohabitans sp. DCL3]|uniref:hypothetical protein n=1 Tax=Limnohabitans sp. DCL3 TaxID=3374103 RepID=UPI003A84E316